jgi:Rieske 2Fe-2S family protein
MDAGFSSTLPAIYYVDPGHYQKELAATFGSMWFCIGRIDEVPQVGDYIVREYLNESILVVRESDRIVNAFYNVCRHRGTLVCEGQGGHSQRLQCPYHAWTYDLSGRLVAAPHFDESDTFQKLNYGLKSIACEIWDGHIFLNFQHDPKPLLEQLAGLPTKFAPWGMSDLRRAARVAYEVAANWKLIIQNYSECLHCPVIHPALSKVSHYLSGVNEPGGSTSTYLGGQMDLREGIATMSLDGAKTRANLPGLSRELCGHVYYYAVLPNLLLSLHPDYMMTHILRPLAVDRTEVICEWHFHPDEMARSGFDASDAVAFWDLTNRQDWHVSELTQKGLNSRSFTPGPYSPREDLLADFDQWIIDRTR